MSTSRRRNCLAATVSLLIAGCAVEELPPQGGLQVGFEDSLRPDVLLREGEVRRVADREASGFWAIVPDLERPERALVQRADSEAVIVVALFNGTGGMRLSPAAADALGIGDEPARVRITALRSEARILAAEGF